MGKACDQCAKTVPHTLGGVCSDCYIVLHDLRELPGPWVADALCAQVDGDLWYPERGGKGTRDAKKVCAVCPVRLLCLEHALRTEEPWGIWGGLTEQERKRLREV